MTSCERNAAFLGCSRRGERARAAPPLPISYQALSRLLEGAGIVTCDEQGFFHEVKGLGLVSKLLRLGTDPPPGEEAPLLGKICLACEQLDGAFSLIFMTSEMVVAVRDPRGFQPLVHGGFRVGDLRLQSYPRQVREGSRAGGSFGGDQVGEWPRQRERRTFPRAREGRVSEAVLVRALLLVLGGFLPLWNLTRYRLGELPAEDFPVDCDFAMAMPDSGMVSLLGYASKLGIPIQQALIRSHDSSRTFIQPREVDRKRKVLMKLAPVPEILEGKKVVVVDDSIVRGTTSRIIVEILRSAGAREVHLRIPSPPVIDSCYYGVDTPTKEELLLFKMSQAEACEYIGADSLEFLSLERIKAKIGNGRHFCYVCFTGCHIGCSKRAVELAV
ncbi:hypothetical protein SELMODRAFT_420135 [Selaginella moellendorffii]|uniref:Uncharacterized protein n=1 Tax=Selaginella moellendorffii TaxID=88036 RepID=D8SB28_SELML|nr:hypothetical protein SELMODRAFT_420135 [Selaginella moellendorffii]